MEATVDAAAVGHASWSIECRVDDDVAAFLYWIGSRWSIARLELESITWWLEETVIAEERWSKSSSKAAEAPVPIIANVFS